MAFTILLVSCSGDKPSATPQGNAMYYWRTAFKLSDAEKNFLTDNNIKALYVKFFDIVSRNGELCPDATLQFDERFPAGVEIVPTIFIAPRALTQAKIPEDLAEMIISRADSMMVKNGYQKAAEIEIDFDWTASNREMYFNLLSEIRQRLHAQDRRLSTTIRLHQLSHPTPPVDYGVLMVYNTGMMQSPTETNSILSTASVEPYLRKLRTYDLPLVTALPIYSWDLLFRNDEFMLIARGLDHTDTTAFTPMGGNRYRAKKYMAVPASSSGAKPGERILPGDILRHESIETDLLDTIVNSIHQIKPQFLNRVILYHLDQKSIGKYNEKELKKIFAHP